MKQQMVYNFLLILLSKLFYLGQLLLCCHLFLHILLLLFNLAAFFLYSHSQLLMFQTKSSSHFLSTKHSHLHLFLFHFCLLSQTIESSLQTHLQLSWKVICFVVFTNVIKSNIFTVTFFIISGMHTLAYGLMILLQFPLHLFTLILYGKTMYSLFSTSSLILHS